MVRRNVDADVKKMLADGLKKNMAANMGHNLKVIADKREPMGMTIGEVTDYLKAFRYVLSEEDWQAIEKFEGAWQALSTAKPFQGRAKEAAI